MTDNLKWYIDAVTHECEKLVDNKFTGNINFQLNWKEGIIGNANIGLLKSIYKITKDK